MRASLRLGLPNLIEQATISVPAGASWLAGAPAQNVKTWRIGECARSTTAHPDHTKIRMQFPSAVSIGAMIVLGHNCSATGTLRLIGGATAGASTIDSGAVPAWRFVPRVLDGRAYPAQIILDDNAAAQWWDLEVSDHANTAGYVDIGRLMPCALWRPTHDAEVGASDAHEELSTVGYAHGGADWPKRNRRPRKMTFRLPYLTYDEGRFLHEMEQVEGTTGEVAVLPYRAPADTQRYGMVGQLRELSGIEWPYSRARGRAFSVRQRV